MDHKHFIERKFISSSSPAIVCRYRGSEEVNLLFFVIVDLKITKGLHSSSIGERDFCCAGCSLCNRRIDSTSKRACISHSHEM
ncbi:hypothetical protein SprV_0200535500 [Sparganum proliferum]